MRNKIIATLFLLPSLAFAEENNHCESVIALSRTHAERIATKTEINREADAFCYEYNKLEASQKNVSLGLKYKKIFSGQFGSGRQSNESVSRKYCSSSNTDSASDERYRTYAEEISPLGYAAYQSCLELSSQDLNFKVEEAQILPSEFTILASYTATGNDLDAVILVNPSKGVSCSSSDAPIAKKIEIKHPQTVPITCSRTDSSKESYVTFARGDIGKQIPMTIPWGRYDEDGNSVSTIESMQKQLSELAAAAEKNSIDINDFHAAHGEIQISADKTRSLKDNTICEDFPGNNRGIIHGRLDFDKPFNTPPAVQIGISRVDASPGRSNDSIRLSIEIENIDEKGFFYSFYTWCSTVVESANANWIAVGR